MMNAYQIDQMISLTHKGEQKRHVFRVHFELRIGGKGSPLRDQILQTKMSRNLSQMWKKVCATWKFWKLGFIAFFVNEKFWDFGPRNVYTSGHTGSPPNKKIKQFVLVPKLKTKKTVASSFNCVHKLGSGRDFFIKDVLVFTFSTINFG